MNRTDGVTMESQYPASNSVMQICSYRPGQGNTAARRVREAVKQVD
jgi:hypothetical protein